jgi:hypothetical protein
MQLSQKKEFYSVEVTYKKVEPVEYYFIYSAEELT